MKEEVEEWGRRRGRGMKRKENEEVLQQEEEEAREENRGIYKQESMK